MFCFTYNRGKGTVSKQRDLFLRRGGILLSPVDVTVYTEGCFHSLFTGFCQVTVYPGM